MLDRPTRDAARHYQSAFFGLESSVCDVNGATLLFLEVFRSIFDKRADEKRGDLDVYVLNPDTVTAMVFAANTLGRMNDAAFSAYYAGHGEDVGER